MKVKISATFLVASMLVLGMAANAAAQAASAPAPAPSTAKKGASPLKKEWEGLKDRPEKDVWTSVDTLLAALSTNVKKRNAAESMKQLRRLSLALRVIDEKKQGHLHPENKPIEPKDTE
jgi:hypothetical protein